MLSKIIHIDPGIIYILYPEYYVLDFQVQRIRHFNYCAKFISKSRLALLEEYFSL